MYLIKEPNWCLESLEYFYLITTDDIDFNS